MGGSPVLSVEVVTNPYLHDRTGLRQEKTIGLVNNLGLQVNVMTARYPAKVWLLVVLICGRQQSTRADDWPQFRGPNRDGVSAEKGLLQKWPDGGRQKRGLRPD